MAEPSAAAEIARLIRLRIADAVALARENGPWVEINDQERHWLFAHRSEDYHRYVIIDTDGTHPVITGYSQRRRVTFDLPQMSDNADRTACIKALVACGALPDEEGMNW